MAVLVSIIICMFAAMEIGKKSPRLGSKQYLWVAFLALIPVVAAVYAMFTMQKPPLY
jgi:TctA family transporter